jgi:hypothetical protein
MDEDLNLSVTLDKLSLAASVVDTLRDTFELPDDIEQRADLLLAVEDLAFSIAKLYRAVSNEVWETPLTKER